MFEDPRLSTNYVDAAALRRYNFFKGFVLVLLVALLLGIGGVNRRYGSISAPVITAPLDAQPPGEVLLRGGGDPNTAVALMLNGAPIGRADVDSSGAWQLETDALDVGQYEIMARALDPDGTVRAQSSPFTLVVEEPVAEVPTDDDDTPVIIYDIPSLQLPEDGTFVPDRVTLTGQGTPGSTVELFQNGEPVGSAEVDNEGNWSLETAVTQYITEFEAKGYDPQGNSIGTSGVDTLLVAALAAPLNLDPPELGPFIAGADGSSNGPIRLAGRGHPGSSVTIMIDGEEKESVDVDENGRWTYEGGIARQPGDYELTVTQTLPGGVVQESVSADITVPEAATVALDDATFDDAGYLTLAGSATPGQSVDILVNGNIVDTLTVGDDGSYTWISPDPFEPGDYGVQTALTGLVDSASEIVSLSLAENDAAEGALSIRYGGAAGVGNDAADTVVVELAGTPAVAVILDASWSMTKPLGDRKRYDAAQDALIAIVKQRLPDETLFVLRAFGNIEGNYSCRTDLMIPYGDLDRTAAVQTIAAIQPRFNANTPIAASLALMAEDLAGATDAERVVVLITDGEETCDGNPSVAVQQIVDSGVDVQVNVVGLAIGDEAVRADFERLAQIGSGAFFNVTDTEELLEVLETAVGTSFTVTDAAGEVVGNGRVGDAPLSLPPGSYTINLRTDPPTIIEDVQIRSDETTQLTLR